MKNVIYEKKSSIFKTEYLEGIVIRTDPTMFGYKFLIQDIDTMEFVVKDSSEVTIID